MRNCLDGKGKNLSHGIMYGDNRHKETHAADKVAETEVPRLCISSSLCPMVSCPVSPTNALSTLRALWLQLALCIAGTLFGFGC